MSLMFCSEDGRARELCLQLFRQATIHRKDPDCTALFSSFCSVDYDVSVLEAYTVKSKYFFSLPPADNRNTSVLNLAGNADYEHSNYQMHLLMTYNKLQSS